MFLGMVCGVGNVDIRITGIVGMTIGGLMNLKKMLVFGLTVMLLVSVVGSSVGVAFEEEATEVSESTRGTGTREDPIMIEDVWDLQGMNEDLDAYYALANDINASETAEWNEGEPGVFAGFEPIGTDDNRFTGGFDGRNHTIFGLYINRPDTDHVGLFGSINTGALVENVGMVEVDVSGDQHLGGLVGRNYGLVSNSYATGNVSGTSTWTFLGGLVGVNEGLVENSYAKGNMSGNTNVGGLVGRNYGTVENSYATGNISGTNSLGGLVGRNAGGTVSNSYTVSNASGTYRVGGLVGDNSGTVENSYATGNISGTGRFTGGLVGSNSGTVENSYATGNVSGNQEVGGLMGINSGTVENSYATGNVSGTSDVGGLVGDNTGTVSNSFYHEDMPECGAGEFGSIALSDEEFGSISTFEYAGWDIEMVETDRDHPFLSWEENKSYATWLIKETEQAYNLTIEIDGGGYTDPVSGTHLIYEQGMIVIEAYAEEGHYFVNWTGDVESENETIVVTVDTDMNITANFKEMEYEISTWEHLHNIRHELHQEYTLIADLDENTEGYEEYVDTDEGWLPIGDAEEPFTGEFHGDGFTISGLIINRSSTDYVGLFGYAVDSNLTDVSLVDYNVSGDRYVGGLVGRNSGSGTVSNSYATGNVSGDDDVGGLVGHNWDGTVSNSYATGNVSGRHNVGGLVGRNSGSGTVSNSYATGNVSGSGNRVGGLVGSNWGSVDNSYATGDVS